MAVSKKMNFKTQFPKILLISYLVLSFLYILMNVFQNTKAFIYNVGIQNGQTQAINAMISRSGECTPFQLTSGNVQVDLINVKCLQAPAETAEGEK